MNPILQSLNDWNIPFELFEHEPFYTCEDAEAFHDQHEGGSSKNLFLRNRKGDQHYLLVVESDKRVDLKALGEELGEKLSFASPERLMKFLHLKPGSVSPLGLIHDKEKHIKVWVDEDLFRHEWLYCHPGRNDQTVKINAEDLKRFLDAVGNDWKCFNVLVDASVRDGYAPQSDQ